MAAAAARQAVHADRRFALGIWAIYNFREWHRLLRAKLGGRYEALDWLLCGCMDNFGVRRRQRCVARG